MKFKRLSDCFFEVFFKLNDYYKKASPRPSPKERGTITRIGDYFSYWKVPVNSAMEYLTMRDHHRVARAFMDIVEQEQYYIDTNDMPVILTKVDEDIKDLVDILLDAYVAEGESELALIQMENVFKKYTKKQLNNNGKDL